MNSQNIADALHELERMIDEEKRQKNQLEKRFDDIYTQSKENPNRDSSRLSNRGKNTSKNYLESMAEEILSLVQKRNELVDSDNIFNVLKKNSSQAAEYKAQVFSQLNVGRLSGDLSKRAGQRKTIHPTPGTTGKLTSLSSFRHSRRDQETRRQGHQQSH